MLPFNSFTNPLPYTNIKRAVQEHRVAASVKTDGGRLHKSASSSLLILRLVYSGGQ